MKMVHYLVQQYPSDDTPCAICFTRSGAQDAQALREEFFPGLPGVIW